MRIKKLIIQNINSLYGKWEINFESSEYAQSGIFAVTGKTGSGKSTILDAICLALYACTPRLKKPVEAISRGCVECLSELTFYDNSGQEWTATYAWGSIGQGANKGQRRAKALHRLSSGGKVMADQTTKVQPLVEEIIGLDEKRFCRAVLLAQGAFDAFLNAGKENSEILERITGTEIYSAIAEKFKERYDAEKAKLDAVKTLFEGITILSEEETEALSKEIADLEKVIAAHTAEQRVLNELIRKFTELELHSSNLAKCAEEELRLAEDSDRFAPSQKRLEDGKKVLEADEKFRPCKELSDKQSVAATELTKNEQKLLEQEKICKETKEKLDADSADSQKYEEEFKELSELLARVSALDTVIKTLGENVRSAAESRSSVTRKALECRRKLSENSKALAALEKNNSTASTYLAGHAEDEKLPLLQKGWESLLENYKNCSRELALCSGKRAASRKELLELQKEITGQEKLFQAESAKYDALAADEVKAQQTLAEALGGAAKEHWQTLHDTQDKCCRQAELCKSLEEHRRQLHDGTECPLCGSKEHPFAAGNMPEPEKEFEALKALKERLAAIENAEKALQKISGALGISATAKLQKQNALDQLKLRFESMEKELVNFSQTEEKLTNDIAAAESGLNEALAPFKLTWDRKKCTLSPEFETRVRTFSKYRASQAEFARKQSELQGARLALHSELKTLLESCRSLRKAWKEETERLEGELRRRKELFGSGDPAEEARKAEAKRKAIAAKLEESGKAAAKADTNCSRTAEEVKKLKELLSRLNEELISARKNFLDACAAAGVSEDEFHASVLDKDTLTRLSAMDAELKARRKQLAETRENCENHIRALSEFLAGKKSKEETAAELAALSEVLQEKNQTIGALKQRFEQDELDKKKMAEKRTELEERKKAMALWDRLYNLIGVKDKFQRFAQGITLEHLLVLANAELEKFSGRYRLLRSRTEELGIDVADKEQGDVIRSCKTLSGGERFLVSLSLALGLSQMAGEKISVDSLFLDEGFGTLDAETLETALSALSNLRNRGKLVGVISHVAELSEKIPCIIEVHKTGGGRSTLSGPGVKKLAVTPIPGYN